jgi:hypothetical protein
MPPQDATAEANELLEVEGKQSLIIIRHGDRYDYQHKEVRPSGGSKRPLRVMNDIDSLALVLALMPIVLKSGSNRRLGLVILLFLRWGSNKHAKRVSFWIRCYRRKD